MSVRRIEFLDLPSDVQDQLRDLRLTLRHWMADDIQGVQVTMDNLQDPNEGNIIGSCDVKVHP